MGIYIGLFVLLILNSWLLKGRPKLFVCISFFYFILVSALRAPSVGIDIPIHYAPNFTSIANSSWSQLSQFTGDTTYDIGFVVFCKLVGCISDDPQVFLAATSIVIYGSVGRYIYRHSDDVYLETFLFMTSFMYFMYMNMIAQALAIAIVLFAMDYLADKKYIKFVVLVLLATLVHGSAILCLTFLPFSLMKASRQKLFWFTAASFIVLLAFSYIVPFVVSTVFPSYAWYIGGRHAVNVSVSKYSIFNVITYLICVLVAVIFIYGKKDVTERKPRLIVRDQIRFRGTRIIKQHGVEVEQQQLGYWFLTCMAIISVLCRVLLHKMEIVDRIGYYEYLFAFTLLGSVIKQIRNQRSRKLIKGFIYIFMGLGFLYFCKEAGSGSYGVVPYLPFWE